MAQVRKNQSSSWFTSFIAELRRRHVGRVAIAYAAGAFVLLQAGEIVLPAFSAPEWGLRLLVVLVLLGFPVAMALAWIYEMTPRGIRRTADLEPAGPGRDRPRLMPRVALLALTVVTAAAVGWRLMAWETPTAGGFIASPASTSLGAPGAGWPVSYDPDAPIRSLAVLPFEDFSAEPQPHFAAGMHDALILELSQIEALRVVSRTSVMRYASTTQGSPEIGRELGVQAIIEGSVTRAGDRVRITVQLIDARSDEHIWSNSYEGDLSDIIALQGRVASEIAREVELELSPEEETRLAQATTVNPEATDAYWRGRYEQSKGTPEGYEAAIRHFQEAVNKDSTFAPAYTGLAGAQLLVGGDDSLKLIRLLPETIEAAEKAVILSANSPEAQAVMAEVKARLGEAQSYAHQRHVVLDSLGVSLDSLRMKVEAPAAVNAEWLQEITQFGEQMRRLYVTSHIERVSSLSQERQMDVARQLESLGEYDRAKQFLRQCVEEDPTNLAAWAELERLHAIRGDYQGSVEVRNQRVERSGESRDVVAAAAELQNAVAERGARGYWEQRLQEISAKEQRGQPVSQVDHATALLALGDHRAALERLERAVEAQDDKIRSLFYDPIWDPLRGDPRFRSLLKKVRATPWRRPPEPPGR